MPRSLVIVVLIAALASWAWRAHVERADGERLAALARPGDIRMISSETCGWCLAARRWMTQQAIPFDECFIERDPACAADYQASGAAGTPTLVVRGQRVVGFDRVRLRELLSAATGSERSSRVVSTGSAALATRLDHCGQKASFA